MRRLGWALIFGALALIGCGGGGAGGSTSTGSGGSGGGTDPGGSSTPAATATFKVDVTTGKVTVLSGSSPQTTAAGVAKPAAVFTGNTVAFNSSVLLNDAGSGATARVMNVSLTNQFGLPIGIDGNGNASGLDVLVGPITNLASAVDLRPLTTISVFAGNGTSGAVNGSALSSEFKHPQGAALDGSGALYVTDDFSANIRKIANGVVTIFAGGGSGDGIGAAAGFTGPHGIAFSPSDQCLYVADYSGNRIRRITSAGRVTTVAGTGSAGASNGAGSGATFSGPDGIAVDQSGAIYVADNLNNRIRKVVLTGSDPTVASSFTVSTLAGTGTAGSANGAGALATFHNPSGIAVDTVGNLYIADTLNNKIRLVDATSGSTTTVAGTGSGTDTDGLGNVATLVAPRGIAVVNGSVVIAENTSGFMREMDVLSGASVSSASSWQVSTLSSGGTGATTGNGTVAQLNHPGFLAASGAGSVFIADTSNFDVRKLTPSSGTFPIGVPGGTPPSTPVTLVNPDGFNPTAGSAPAPYLHYTGSLASGASSAAKLWSFNVPAGVNAFTFTVTVSSAVSVVTPLDSSIGNSNNHNYVLIRYNRPAVGPPIDGGPTQSTTGDIQALACDAAGDLFEADTQYDVIRRVSQAGITTSIAGVSGVTGHVDGSGRVAEFNEPIGVATSRDGTTLYVAELTSGYIRKLVLTPGSDPSLSASWTVYSIAGGGSTAVFTSSPGNTAGLNGPYGIALDPTEKYVYFSEFGGNRIRRLAFTGTDPTNSSSYTVTNLAGDASQLSGQTGSTDGTGLTARFHTPEGLTVTPDGNVVVADFNNDNIRLISPGGTVITLAGTGSSNYIDGPASTASFDGPTSVVADPSGLLVYVADTYALRVRAVSIMPGVAFGGTVSTVAGTGNATASQGPASSAGLFYPVGMALDSTGDLYVINNGSNQISEVVRNYSTASP